MEIRRITRVYFSPTGTTRKVLNAIAEGFGREDTADIDLTRLTDGEDQICFSPEELVIIGAPVYGGRLPVDAVSRFKRLKADNTPAVVIVVYGNREFEDALLELKKLLTELGFALVAGGAFIGEHSFSTAEMPVAEGRPDSSDLTVAKDFGAAVRDKILATAQPHALPELEVPGRFPYESGGARPMTVAPVTDETACTVCNICAEVCPTSAITVNERVETDTGQCIRCCACIKDCPENARSFDDSMMETIAKWLYDNCRERKAPQLFGVES